jgi:hypothetical protein
MALLALAGVASAPASVPAQPPPQAKDSPAKKDRRKSDDIIRIEGRLSNTDPIDKVRLAEKPPGCFHKVHECKMTPGKTYVIEMTDPTWKKLDPKNFDPFLRVEDSAGKPLASDDDSGGNQNARIVFTPTKEDNYRIIATTGDPGREGPYALTIRPVPQGAVIDARPGFPLGLCPTTTFGEVSITPLPSWGSNQNMGGASPDTHGYVEYRFIVENLSETEKHRVTLTLPRWQGGYYSGHYLRALRKTVELGPNDTALVSLLQPDLAIPFQNSLEVEIDGRTQDRTFEVGVVSNRGGRSNRFFGGGSRTPMATILMPGGAVQDQINNSIWRSALGKPPTPPPGWAGGTSRSGVFTELGPYFNKQYWYFQTHFFQPASDSFDQWSKHWLGYSSFDGVALTGAVWDAAPPEVQAAVAQYVECGGTLLILGDAKLPESWQRVRTTTTIFADFHPGFGQCLMTKAPPDKWDPDEWQLVTKMWDHSLNAWQQIRSPSEANREFPVVEGLGIPVRGLFVAMLVFVVAIGPVNIAWLTRSRRRIWLLWTVPACSLVTCAALVGYMLLTEGWHGHVRAEGITVLDEAGQRAATIGWTGFYCPTSPAGGLHFSADTELTPHLNIRSSSYAVHQPYAIDWSNGQHLYEGWITAKVPMHFMTRRNEKRIERLTVRKNDDGSLAVVNGLSADIQDLWLADAEGRIHTAGTIHAGAETKLMPTQERAKNQMAALNKGMGGLGTWVAWAEDIPKRPENYLRPGCYLAVINDSPFLEQGLRRVQSRNLRSVVFGILKEMP